MLSINKPEGQKIGLPTLPTSSPFYLLTFECFSVRLGGFVIFCCCHVERLRTCPLIGASDNGSMARVGFSSLNVNQMAGNKGMIAVCLRSRQQEQSRNGPLDLVETHNNQQLQRQQRAVPLLANTAANGLSVPKYAP